MTKIVYVAGTWDLFHPGHVNILRESKKLGRVIVAVSTSDLVYECKGKYPIMSLRERINTLNACKYVDEIVIQTKILDIRQLKLFNVDIIVIGDDWKDKENAGIEYIKHHGKVVFLPYTKGVSTTEIKQRIRNGTRKVD